MENTDGIVQENTVSLSEERRKFSGSAKDVYCQLLVVKEFPKSPEEMPKKVFLPPGVLGDLEEAILMTENDGRERSQSIGWQGKEQGFKPGKLFLGSSWQTSVLAAFDDTRRAFFGSKALISFHTHPGGALLFSPKDIAMAKVFPRESFIHMVGCSLGVGAIFQTKESSKLPLSSSLAGPKVMRRLEKEGFMESTAKMVELLKREGLAFYFWHPPGERVKEGDLKKGINFIKVQ